MMNVLDKEFIQFCENIMGIKLYKYQKEAILRGEIPAGFIHLVFLWSMTKGD